MRLFTRIRVDEAAAVLHGAVLDAATAPPVYGTDADRLAAVAATLRGRLGAEVMAVARARGRAMADHEVIRFARREIDRALSASEASVGTPGP